MAGFGAKVKLTVDRSSKAEFNKQINDLVGQIKISNKFTVLQKDMDRVRREAQAMLNSNPMTLKIGKIDCSAAVTNVKRQLQTMLSSLSIQNGVNITGLKDFIGTEGVDAAMRSTADAANAAVQKMNEAKTAAAGWAGQMAVLDSIAKGVASTYKSGISGNNMIADEAEIQRITAAYNVWAQKVKEVKANRSGDIEALQQEGLAIQRNITAIQNKQVAEDRAARAKEVADKREQAANQIEIASLKQIAVFRERMTRFLQSNSKLNYSESGNSIRTMLGELNRGTAITTDRLKEMEGEFANIRTQAAVTGSLGRSILDSLHRAYERFGGWMLITRSLMAVIRTIKSMVNNVREIDSALTQLQIVTGATDEQLTAFLTNATSLAKDLGKSIKDVLGSIETFSRLGYNLEDASVLAEYANILSNVASVETDAATTGLTSIIKGFNMEVTEAEHIADVLVEVGQKYAVSASEMMEAYEKSGAALNATNTSFEKSAGLIAAANASVQNASTVGTALKTISARIRGATADLEELGEDTSELAQGFSKYAKEIKALTGFDIMVDGSTDTYKDIYDIFEGIAKVWDDLSDTQQARVSEILGGTRQLQVISSILGNWKDAAGAYADAMASAGTATEANAVYMDSINARIGVFKATFQEFSNNLFNSGLIKFFVDLGTSIVSVLNAFEKLHLLVPMITAAVVAIKAIRVGLATMHSAVASAETASRISTIVSQLIAEKGATNALTASIINLTAAERAELATKIQAAVTSGSLTAAEAEQIMATLGLATAEGTLTVANQTLGASFKALMASIPVWGWIALGVSVLIPIVTALAGAFKSSEERLNDLNEEFDELTSKIRTAESEFRSLRDSAEEIIPRFAELAKGVNQFGENVSLTDEEYAEFISMNNRIAEMFPEINLGMDSNGNAMLALSYSADTLTDSLYALVEAERQAASAEMAKTMPNVISNIESAEKEYKRQIRAAKDVIDEWKDVYEDIVNQDLPTNVGRYATMEDGYRATLDFIEKAQRLGMHGDVLVDNQQTTNNGYVFKIQWDYDMANLQYAQEALDSIIAGQNSVINNYENLIDARWAELNRVVGYWAETNFLYNDLDSQMRDVAKTMISGIDFASLGLDTEEKVQNYVEDNILRPLFLATPEVKEAFENLLNLKDALKSGKMSEDEFREQVQNMFDGLFESINTDQRDAFLSAFIAGYNAVLGTADDDFNTVVGHIIDGWVALNSAFSDSSGSAAIGDLAEEITELKKAYDLLKTAQEEMASGGLSADTITALADAEENYLDYLYEENGIIKLNTRAWEEKANAKLKADIASLRNSIAALEAENAALQENIDLYNEKAYDTMNTAEMDYYFRLVNEATAELNANSAAIAENQELLGLYERIYNSITGAAGQWETTLNVFDTATSSLQSLASAQATLANGYTLSAEKARELAGVYPELLDSATTSANGQITLNAAVVNEFIKGKEAEIKGAVDAEIKKLEAKESVLQAELDIVDAQIKAVESGNEEEVKSANEAAAAKMALEQAVLSACEQAGIDETTANQLALAAMTGDWDTFETLAETAVNNLDDESAVAFNNVMTNFAITSQNMVDNTNEVIGAFSQMGLALQNAMNGLTTSRYGGKTSADKVSGNGKEAVAGLLSDMFEAEKSAYGDSAGNTYDGALDEWKRRLQEIVDTYAATEPDLSALYKQRDSINSQIAAVQGQIGLLKSLKNTSLNKFNTNTTSSNTSEVEEYIATIDEFRDAIERLRKAQEEAERLETEIENSGSYEKKIALQKELISAYRDEQAALHDLNNARDASIANSADYLRSLGFDVEYNADTNELWISNLEHLNELTADSKGKYKTLQEATNALRKGTEDLINTITDLNDANREGSETWMELNRQIIETTVSMYENARQAKENSIKLAENWMEIAMENGNLPGVAGNANAIVDYYKQMQDLLHEQAEFYRAQGYSDTSDEVSELSDLWWDYAQEIKDVRDQVVDNLLDMVDTASEMVDEVQNVYDTLHDAAEEFASNGGFISVDSLQSIYDLGPQYMQYLEDENGLLVINEERINAVIAAKTEQLALENAMSYVERLRLAALGESNESLNALCFATTEATNTTWGLVYAQLEQMRLAGELTDAQYNAAMHNIQAIQALSRNAIAGIGRVSNEAKDSLENLKEELTTMQDGVEGIIKYVMDMLKQRIQDQIDALEEMKDAYAKIIDLRKEALDAAKDEADYEDEVADKIKEIAKLQERINALSLDDSRDAQAQKIQLEEEMSELQKELSDTQADYAREAQKDALDDMQEAYEEQKDQEIAALEKTISSYQKLYDMAIDYINQHWRTLYQELIDWNYEYGSTGSCKTH